MYLRRTPVDGFTGLPYPIITGSDIDTLKGINVVNKNHAFFPKADERLRTVGGLALRVCRLQTVEAKFHNYGDHAYHNFYYGPPIPERETEQLRTIIFALGGYIPKQGIDLNGTEPLERDMTVSEYERLRTLVCGDYKYFTYGYSPIRLFLRKVILDNAINVDIDLLEQFVSSRNANLRREIGHTILHYSAESSTSSVDNDYVNIFSDGYLRPLAPERPVSYMKKVINNQDRVEQYMFGPLKKVASYAVSAA